MSNNARKTALPTKAKLCQITGHDWQKTSSPTVQVCTRGDCKQVRQLINGHWRYVTTLDSKKNMHEKAVEAVEIWQQMRLV